jgi:hypothetical protein
MSTFDTKVNGIPCQCRVTAFSPEIPMRVYGPGMEDADPPEEGEFEFELLDRRGRPALWLDRYVTPEVVERLLEEFDVDQQAQYYSPY